MGKKSPPPAPDYTAAADKQAQSSKEVTNMATWANRPEISTPWGQMNWTPSATTDPSTGQNVTKWNMDLQLSPQQQASLDSEFAIQQGRTGAAQDLLGQATDAFKTPMDWSNLPQRGTLGDPNAYRQKAQDAVDQLNAPNLAQRRAATETQLSNQGIGAGSEAYTNKMRDVNDAETRAHLMAIASGRDEAAQMFGQNLQSANFANQNRQQAITEGEYQRSQPLNELNALLTGQQVSQPNMPSFNTAGASQPGQYLTASGMQHSADMDNFNAKQGVTGGMMNGLFSLGNAAMQNGGWASLFAL